MKYKIKNSDLFINNKLHPEGSEVDLTKEQTKGIENFLSPCHSEQGEESFTKGHSALDAESISESNETKTKSISSKALAKEGKGNKK